MSEKSWGVTLSYAMSELPPETRAGWLRVYTAIADMMEKVLGERPFAPHEHLDQHIHDNLTPADIRAATHTRITKHTMLLVVIAGEPSHGSGMEVVWAETHSVPGVLVIPRHKYDRRRISSQLCGSSIFGNQSAILYDSPHDLVEQLCAYLVAWRDGQKEPAKTVAFA